MSTIRTVTLSQRDDGVHVCRIGAASGGYSSDAYFNDGASFTSLDTGVEHFTRYGYTVDTLFKTDGMVTMQRVTD